MTVKQTVTNQLCEKCHADVRRGALFCYSCGSAVAAEKGADGSKSAAESNEPIIKPDAKIRQPAANSIAVNNAPEIAEKAEPKNNRLAVEKETTLKTAASVRRQAKTQPKKSVEVVWKQPEQSANILFIIATVILILFAVGALTAMLYLR